MPFAMCYHFTSPSPSDNIIIYRSSHLALLAMKRSFLHLMTRFKDSEKESGLSDNGRLSVLLAPLVTFFLFALFLTIPSTRQFTKFLLTENQPVELLTFVALFIGSILSGRLGYKAWQNGERFTLKLFYGLFAFLLFLVAMEEIAWGQWFFGFETPESLKAINRQEEVTLHNIEGMHGRTEYIRLAFGVFGLIGIRLRRVAFFKHLTPSILLLPWFLLVTITTIPDIWNDYTLSHNNFEAIFDFLSELNEMLIGIACLLLVWFNAKSLNKKWDRIRQQLPPTYERESTAPTL